MTRAPRRSAAAGSGAARTHLRGFLLALCVPFLLVGAGTAGYHLIEGWSLFDALYMTVITLTTIGFGELHPLSTAGRVFTIVLTTGGVFTVFYAATAVIRAVVGGELQSVLGRQRMERSLAELDGHVIVCGYGRMGRLVCQELSAHQERFVVIDRDAAAVEGFELPHGIALAGDATHDDVLLRAGVERARALVTVATSDADNLYVTMSARLLNDKLHIVSRSEDEAAERKLLRAGATRVISPYVIGGNRVALAVLRPAVLDFIELATRSHHLEIQLEETEVAAQSRFAGATVHDCRFGAELGIILVAIRRPSGEMVFNPEPEARVAARDTLLTLGSRERLDRFEAVAAGAGEGGPRGSVA